MENYNSLFEHFSFTVDKGQTPLRIDKYLMNFVENATRTKIQAAAKSGSIQVNGDVVKSNYKVKPKDEIKVLFVGGHVAALPKETLKNETSIDFVCLNEGVYAISNLLKVEDLNNALFEFVKKPNLIFLKLI